MKEAISVFYSKKLVFFLFLLFVFMGGLLLMSSEKEAFHLILNRYHNPFFDIFFKYATYLGDGIIFPIVIVGLLLFKRNHVTAFLISGIMTLIISYVLKNWVFIDFARPYEVFGDQLHIVEGVKMRRWHSFPSGHTTAAFALFMLAVFFSKKISWQMTFFTIAIIAGLSRIYLSQHFLQDVIGGAILGIIIALISYQLAARYPFFRK